MGELLREDLRGEGGASNLAFDEKVKGLQAAGQRIFHFAFGQSPFPVPQPFIRHLQDTAGCNDYLPVAGLPDLRKAIVAFHAEWEGVTLNEGGLVVGPGSKELIYLTMAVFSGTVWLEGLPGPHLLILTNPGNPSGCAYTREELEALVRVFRRLSVIVLSDEIYARLEYTGQHVCMS